MSAREILLKTISPNCYWAEMDNLTNTDVGEVLKAMEVYAEQKKKELLNKFGRHCGFGTDPTMTLDELDEMIDTFFLEKQHINEE